MREVICGADRRQDGFPGRAVALGLCVADSLTRLHRAIRVPARNLGATGHRCGRNQATQGPELTLQNSLRLTALFRLHAEEVGRRNALRLGPDAPGPVVHGRGLLRRRVVHVTLCHLHVAITRETAGRGDARPCVDVPVSEQGPSHVGYHATSWNRL